MLKTDRSHFVKKNHKNGQIFIRKYMQLEKPFFICIGLINVIFRGILSIMKINSDFSSVNQYIQRFIFFYRTCNNKLQH